VTVREMQRSDLEPVRKLGAQLIGHEVGLDELARHFRALADDPDDYLLVAVEGDEVVGCLHAHLTRLLYHPPFAEVVAVVVDARRRRRGAGQGLLAAAEAWGARVGCAQMRLRSRTSRVEAHLFFERLGYAVEKTQHAFVKRLVRPDRPG
jgi:GNAT superfamily N-acetyltransferase